MRGQKRVIIKKTTTTSKCSALLAVSLSGNKLIPFVVFNAVSLNGKVLKETETYDKRARYSVGPKGFCDTRIMLAWIEEVLTPYILANGGGPNSGIFYAEKVLFQLLCLIIIKHISLVQ
jgi:hypothetical protein